MRDSMPRRNPKRSCRDESELGERQRALRARGADVPLASSSSGVAVTGAKGEFAVIEASEAAIDARAGCASGDEAAVTKAPKKTFQAVRARVARVLGAHAVEVVRAVGAGA